MPMRAQQRLQCCYMGRTDMNPAVGVSMTASSAQQQGLPYYMLPHLPTCLMYKSGGSMHSMAAASCSSLYKLGSWSSDA